MAATGGDDGDGAGGKWLGDNTEEEQRAQEERRATAQRGVAAREAARAKARR